MRCPILNRLFSTGYYRGVRSWASEEDPEDFLAEYTKHVVRAWADDGVCSEIGVDHLVLIPVNVEEADKDDGEVVSLGVAGDCPRRINRGFLRFALWVLYIDIVVCISRIPGLNTITTLLEEPFVTSVLIPPTNILVEIKWAFQLNLGAAPPCVDGLHAWQHL